MLTGMSTLPAGDLSIVSRSASELSRTLAQKPQKQQRLQPLSGMSQDAAYRRLAAVMLRLDVASLASDLRAERLQRGLPRAA